MTPLWGAVLALALSARWEWQHRTTQRQAQLRAEAIQRHPAGKALNREDQQ